MIAPARAAGEWLRRRAENVAAALLAVMFAAFLVQIVFRYLVNFPLGWTAELTLIAWLWVVLWGAAFVVRERDEIRFDLVYGAVGPRARRAFGAVAALALVALYGAAFPATVDYIAFMKVQPTAYFKIRTDYLYSVFGIFAAAAILRYLWLLWRALAGPGPAGPDAIASNRDPAP
jgi:TRAP-type C4-dicarboxylate transport system permease small subunit